MSQLEVALEAEVSPRHLSFLETGRSRPSAEMLLVLSSVLDVPLRDRNALLMAGGFAPAYRETDLDAPEMAPIRTVIDFMLKQAEPYGAVLVDGAWNLLQSNGPAAQVTGRFVVDPVAVLAEGPPNLLRLLLHPRGVRDRCPNWEEVARSMIARATRELAIHPHPELARTVEEVLAYEGVPGSFREVSLREPATLLLPLHLRHEGLDLRLFSTITSLGTAQDITLSELRIEHFFPADPATDRAVRAMAAS